MKTGAGEDPFADDDQVSEPPEEVDESDDEPPVESKSESSDGKAVAVEETGDSSTSTSESSTGSTGADDGGTQDIPWVLRRQRVKDERDNVHQFFLRQEYSEREDEIVTEVAEALDMREKDVQKLDVREAMVATADAADIAAKLEEWGYEYLK
jgi:hypothetical protein